MFSSSVFLPLQWSFLKSVPSLSLFYTLNRHISLLFTSWKLFQFCKKENNAKIKISLLSSQPYGRPLFPLSLWFFWNPLCIISSFLGNLCCSTLLVPINSTFPQILLKDPNLSNFKLMHNSCMNLIWLSQLVSNFISRGNLGLISGLIKFS